METTERERETKQIQKDRGAFVEMFGNHSLYKKTVCHFNPSQSIIGSHIKPLPLHTYL